MHKFVRRVPALARVGLCVLGIGFSPLLFGQSADILERMGLAGKAIVERELMVSMRDGTRLSTAVIRPVNASRPLPVILIRTPYDKDGELVDDPLFKSLVPQGYAIVVQNERGTEWSEGKYHFLTGARTDGYDAIEWIVHQPWSNGKVGTIGCSSSAEHQLGLAAMNHPGHKAMIAMGSSSGIGDIPGVSGQGGFYKGGVPNLEWAGWFRQNGQIHRPKLPADISPEERVRLADTYATFLAPATKETGRLKELAARSLEQLPSRDILRRIGVPATDFDTMITLSPADPFWRSVNFIHSGDHPRVPALYVDAWYDFPVFATLKLFEYVKDTPNQFLLVAPTEHCSMRRATADTKAGTRSIGDARYDYDGLITKWFDHWLKDEANDVLDRHKVVAYLMGAGVWKSLPSWPVPGARMTRLFLHSDGHANSRLGTGNLSTARPPQEAADAFLSDPLHPVPYQGGLDEAPVVQDQANVELRHDLLVYSTEPLKQGVAIMGEIKAVFYVAVTSPDADLAVKLVDVYPDGTAYNLSDTMLRLRYRDGFEHPKLMKPDEIYRADVTGLVTGNYFPPGHRIRLDIAGSNSHYERNLQTGGKNYDETNVVVATVAIQHDAKHPSYIDIPVIEP